MENICPICSEPMILRPAGISKKTGKPYQAFLSCPNYKNHSKQTTYQPVKETSEAIISEEIQTGFKEINERLDKIIAFLVSKIK